MVAPSYSKQNTHTHYFTTHIACDVSFRPSLPSPPLLSLSLSLSISVRDIIYQGCLVIQFLTTLGYHRPVIAPGQKPDSTFCCLADSPPLILVFCIFRREFHDTSTVTHLHFAACWGCRSVDTIGQVFVFVFVLLASQQQQ